MEKKEGRQFTVQQSVLVSLGVFLVVMLSMLFVAGPVQSRLGMIGLLITELILLAIALVAVYITKAPFKEVFPLELPRPRFIVGTIFIWFGTYIIILLSTLIVGCFFPEGLNNVSTAMNTLFVSIPLWARFLIVAVSPAICEEAVHRGVILHFLKPVEKKWSIILIMAFLFGLFHLSIYRFLPTAILGGAITYIAIETKNIFYPFLLHMIHNSLSVFVSELAQPGSEVAEAAADTTAVYSLLSVGAYFIIACVVPWLLWAGVKLVHKKDAERRFKTWQKLLFCVLVSLLCIIVGVFLVSLGSLNGTVGL